MIITVYRLIQSTETDVSFIGSSFEKPTIDNIDTNKYDISDIILRTYEIDIPKDELLEFINVDDLKLPKNDLDALIKNNLDIEQVTDYMDMVGVDEIKQELFTDII